MIIFLSANWPLLFRCCFAAPQWSRKIDYCNFQYCFSCLVLQFLMGFFKKSCNVAWTIVALFLETPCLFYHAFKFQLVLLPLPFFLCFYKIELWQNRRPLSSTIIHQGQSHLWDWKSSKSLSCRYDSGNFEKRPFILPMNFQVSDEPPNVLPFLLKAYFKQS